MNEMDFGSYADDNGLFIATNNTVGVIKLFEKYSAKLFRWFTDD